MHFAIREIEPDAWRVEVDGTVRIVRYRSGLGTFAPWDISTAEGRRLWAAPSLESAFRWIQARTGYPTEALLVEGLLERTASNTALGQPAPSETFVLEETAGAVVGAVCGQ